MLKTVSTISGFVSPTFTGDVTLSNGNLIIGTSGKGIDFSATPGTGTSELFSDYEEGTWTPVCNPNGGAITTQTCSGTYTKVGRLVTVQMSIVINNAGTAPSLASITGLPFTSANTDGVGSGCLREFNAVGATWNFTVSPNTNEMFPARYDNTNAIISGFAWRGSVSYFV